MLTAFDGNNISYKLLRMNFSDEMNENGKLSYKKIFRLFKLSFLTIKALLFYKPDYVYYPPAGPEKVPVYRDMIILFFVRLFKKKIVFHFHAGGLSDIYPALSPVIKRLFRFVFFNPEYAICFSEQGKRDPRFLHCNHITIIPSGVDDISSSINAKKHGDNFTVLFVGVCRETKGILDFLKVIEIAHKRNDKITGRIIGKTFSDKEKEAIDEAVNNNIVRYEGIKTGEDKNNIFNESDLFLFPTFFEHENFPTVILEAFSAGLPVVATNWRGVKDQVHHNENGYLHEVHDVNGMSDSIVKLATDKELYQRLAKNARLDYERNYSVQKFEKNIINFFTTLK